MYAVGFAGEGFPERRRAVHPGPYQVQSQKGKGDLAERMCTCYRINDKYRVPVTAIAIFADGNKSYRPTIGALTVMDSITR